MTRRTEAIEQFIDYFRSQADLIETVNVPVYRKTLYATALDPLARSAFGNIGHRKRIIRLIDQLTSWKAKDSISLPQAALNLRNEKRGRYRLYRKIKRQLDSWPPGHILRIDDSPSLVSYKAFSTTLEYKLIERCRYAELFYTYRNNLIHEFREPGYGIEMSSDGNSPYYTSMINEPWQLVFPVGFFNVLFLDALDGLEKYLKRNKIDPYNNFEFGSLWRGR
jgi:hypothetical protein